MFPLGNCMPFNRKPYASSAVRRRCYLSFAVINLRSRYRKSLPFRATGCVARRYTDVTWQRSSGGLLDSVLSRPPLHDPAPSLGNEARYFQHGLVVFPGNLRSFGHKYGSRGSLRNGRAVHIL